MTAKKFNFNLKLEIEDGCYSTKEYPFDTFPELIALLVAEFARLWDNMEEFGQDESPNNLWITNMPEEGVSDWTSIYREAYQENPEKAIMEQTASLLRNMGKAEDVFGLRLRYGEHPREMRDGKAHYVGLTADCVLARKFGNRLVTGADGRSLVLDPLGNLAKVIDSAKDFDDQFLQETARKVMKDNWWTLLMLTKGYDAQSLHAAAQQLPLVMDGYMYATIEE